MSRIARFVVLVTALMSLFAVMSSTAGAVTWHNTGNTSFTATGGAGTLGVGSSELLCSSSDATGTSPVTTTTNVLATGTVAFTGCTLIGIPTHVNCTYRLTGSTATAADVTGVADVHCLTVTTLTGSRCTITGTTPATYTQPVAPTRGRLHLLHSSALSVSTPSGSSCPFSGASATLTAQTFSITAVSGGTGTLGPIFTRTA